MSAENNKWSSVEIRFILECYYRPEPWSPSAATPLIRQNMHRKFTDLGLIDAVSTPTPAGHAFIEKILNTPLPVKVEYWVYPEDEDKTK